MKGITVWIWIIAGIIIAFLLFTVFIQLMGFITMSREKENALQSFQDLTGVVDSFCDTRSEAKVNKHYPFPESVSNVYSTSDPKKYFENNSRTYGNNVCMILMNETNCQQVRCSVEFHPIKNNQNVLSLVDQILGQSHYQDYFLTVVKTDCGVSVLRVGENPSSFC